MPWWIWPVPGLRSAAQAAHASLRGWRRYLPNYPGAGGVCPAFYAIVGPPSAYPFMGAAAVLTALFAECLLLGLQDTVSLEVFYVSDHFCTPLQPLGPVPALALSFSIG